MIIDLKKYYTDYTILLFSKHQFYLVNISFILNTYGMLKNLPSLTIHRSSDISTHPYFHLLHSVQIKDITMNVWGAMHPTKSNHQKPPALFFLNRLDRYR